MGVLQEQEAVSQLTFNHVALSFTRKLALSKYQTLVITKPSWSFMCAISQEDTNQF